MKHGALMHDAGDDVAVVVQDVSPGTEVRIVTLDGAEQGSVQATEDIPLSHKIAIRDITSGSEVTKYGRTIGRATKDIARGAHVHTQNIKTVRWA